MYKQGLEPLFLVQLYLLNLQSDEVSIANSILQVRKLRSIKGKNLDGGYTVCQLDLELRSSSSKFRALSLFSK